MNGQQNDKYTDERSAKRQKTHNKLSIKCEFVCSFYLLTQFNRAMFCVTPVLMAFKPLLVHCTRLQLKCDGTRRRREVKWRGNWRMEWVASTLHTVSEHGVPTITTADGTHLGCQQSTELTPPFRFKWTRPFRRKTKSVFCACAITFQLACTYQDVIFQPPSWPGIVSILIPFYSDVDRYSCRRT